MGPMAYPLPYLIAIAMLPAVVFIVGLWWMLRRDSKKRQK